MDLPAKRSVLEARWRLVREGIVQDSVSYHDAEVAFMQQGTYRGYSGDHDPSMRSKLWKWRLGCEALILRVLPEPRSAMFSLSCLHTPVDTNCSIAIPLGLSVRVQNAVELRMC
jgi:hypothetical protein